MSLIGLQGDGSSLVTTESLEHRSRENDRQ